MGSHPIDPGREDTRAVFFALLDAIETMSDWTRDDRARWEARYRDAQSVEQRRRDYNRAWDDSLRTVGRTGQ